MKITKSVVRHAITGLSAVALFVGLNHFVPVLDYIALNLDSIWAAGTALVAFVVGLFGFEYGRPKEAV